VTRWYHGGIIAPMAMTLRLSDAETAELRDYAAATGRSMQEVARDAIRDYIAARAEMRAAILSRIVAEDRDLLDLLAQ
jgi:predicted transcriptional regulator